MTHLALCLIARLEATITWCHALRLTVRLEA
jgi:hypothetical protein